MVTKSRSFGSRNQRLESIRRRIWSVSGGWCRLLCSPALDLKQTIFHLPFAIRHLSLKKNCSIRSSPMTNDNYQMENGSDQECEICLSERFFILATPNFGIPLKLSAMLVQPRHGR